MPGLHYWEFGNVLRTYVRRLEIEAELAWRYTRLHLEASLDSAEPDRAALLTTDAATVYDAVHIALSRGLELPLLTAERTTTPWVVKLGRDVLSVRKA